MCHVLCLFPPCLPNFFNGRLVDFILLDPFIQLNIWHTTERMRWTTSWFKVHNRSLKNHGVDFSYHVWSNVSLIRGIIWDISVHNIQKVKFCFSLVCIYNKVIKTFEVNVDQQNKAVKFREKIDNRCATPHIEFDVIWYSMSPW